ncbi:hypothetical protein KR51_00026450 [Rubidibacter lacunae KORDI 51-2]|uniref:Uncharacterized protein n=1 Tax=Rubidibacter lacunae KORDI 51-2 TaxID=582515 RepID=U5DIA1_9CHRO|nr:hypothetical protein [Rubidibacter lacunae]ERN40662.1 hypothetical protein KR51_00026450 [Rubidibacter lacunae KORDI 51-2]
MTDFLVRERTSERSPAAACHISFDDHVERLHRFTVTCRWVVVGTCWLVLTPLALWAMRGEFDLWHSHFTFAAVRYALRYNLPSTLTLSFCLGFTTATLMWQSRNILFGWPLRYRRGLEKQVRYILACGPQHPLWRWTVGKLLQ